MNFDVTISRDPIVGTWDIFPLTEESNDSLQEGLHRVREVYPFYDLEGAIIACRNRSLTIDPTYVDSDVRGGYKL